MTKSEFKMLNDVKEIANVIIGHELKNKRDRTLIYGYNCDRSTFHVYLLDGVIYRHIYSNEYMNTFSYKMSEWDIIDSPYGSNEYYKPDKRVYPECCDMEFCIKLVERGVLLPFTTFGQVTEIKEIYGEI